MNKKVSQSGGERKEREKGSQRWVEKEIVKKRVEGQKGRGRGEKKKRDRRETKRNKNREVLNIEAIYICCSFAYFFFSLTALLRKNEFFKVMAKLVTANIAERLNLIFLRLKSKSCEN